ncbi:nuclear transport factor 2 family protein [Xanthocytophaga agilis]|uniref:Nuclear transport factor 2 family protein n=1 Tax=Xanthocytophaga agilis TaxID=3048010 RepID=A0AAE3UI98_9BACT|nr:nuclear transport factor 2 family protein [Xanthocytophaga agilis]MDJ1505141.1 nuclear transport factor 2 family protein [Xanthocytophaga agilis]
MLTKEIATEFAHDWVDSWNKHDLDRVLDHYTDDFEMTTPLIVSLMNEPSGTLSGKDRVRNYWEKGLEKYPDLHFQIIDVLSSVSSVTIYYTSVLNKKAVEFFLFNEQGKVYKAIAHYD